MQEFVGRFIHNCSYELFSLTTKTNIIKHLNMMKFIYKFQISGNISLPAILVIGGCKIAVCGIGFGTKDKTQ